MLYEQLARAGKALGNGKRLELIQLLAQGPRWATSAHLQTLKDAGLVAADQAGTTIRYRISGRGLAALYDRVLAVAAARSADVDATARRYLGPDDTERTDRQELLRRVGGGEAVLLDVRPVLEYEAGHVPGSGLDSARGVRRAAGRVARRPRGCRLLSQRLMRLLTRCGAVTYRARAPGRPANRGDRRMAGDRRAAVTRL